ncbi:phosphatases II [Auricularia subglabra TFB-10046 SS5]|nr:phosphatases II [Auricularia subglabra TFB-10046 SS5]
MNEIVPGLFLGSWKAAHDVDALRRAGITHVLTAMALGFIKLENLASAEPAFTLLQLPILDSIHFDLIPLLPQCVQFIQDALDSGGKVLVHCFAGVSRSATVVTAYLVASRGLAPIEALQLVRKHRPCVAPNAGFVRQLELFYRSVKQQLEDEKVALAAAAPVVSLAPVPA